jgi:D-alanine-D-alanine ligase
MSIGIDEDSVRVVDASFGDFVARQHRRFGQPALVQAFVAGDEIGVPIARIGSPRALPPVAFRQRNGQPFGERAKTFRDELTALGVRLVSVDAPSGLSDAAELAFRALEMGGVGRIDFRVDTDGQAWAFDTNESPPPLPGTSYATAMRRLGFGYEPMLAVWLGIGLMDAGLLSGV